MKTLRENDSGYRIDPVGAGLGNWVVTKIEGDADHICKNPMASVEPLSSRQLFSLVWGRFYPRCTYATLLRS